MLTSNRQIGSLLTLQINLLCPFFFYNKNLTRLHSGISARLTIQANLRLCLFSKEEMVAVGGFLKFKTDPRLRVFNVTDALKLELIAEDWESLASCRNITIICCMYSKCEICGICRAIKISYVLIKTMQEVRNKGPLPCRQQAEESCLNLIRDFPKSLYS